MKSSIGMIGLIASLLSLGLIPTAVGQVRVSAQVDTRTAIYPDETFTYSIIVTGGPKPERVDTSPLAEFQPRQAGTRSSMSNRYGRMSSSYIIDYALRALRPGPIRLAAVTVTVEGKAYKTNPVELTIVRPGTTDKMKVDFHLSQSRCFVGEPITMTVTWTLETQAKEGSFNVPVFRSQDFLFEDLAQDLQGSPSERHSLHGVPVTIRQQSKRVRGVNVNTIAFSKVLIPQKAGTLDLGRVTVSAGIAAGRVRTNDLFNRYVTKYERVSVNSQTQTLQVAPLPQADPPAGYYGLVGRYAISAQATPTEVSVGDPITLTIRIGGNDFLKPIQWPRLDQVPGLKGNFKVPSEKASPLLADGFKVFTQTIRASHENVKEIPAIPLAYFDPDQGKYVTAQTDPIKLLVAPTKILTNVDMGGQSVQPVNREVQAIKEGLAANYYNEREVLRDLSFSPLLALTAPLYLALWSLPLAGLLGSLLWKGIRHSSPEKKAQQRRQRSASVATGKLRTVLSQPQDQQHCQLFGSILKQYLGDRFDRSAGSLTAADCLGLVETHTDDAQLARQMSDLVDVCEAAHYSTAQTDIDADQIVLAIRLIRDIHKQAKK